MIFGLPRLYAAAGAAILVALLLGWVWRIDSLRAAHKRDLAACQTRYEQFVQSVKDKTELARLSDAAHAAQVERDQEKARADNDTEIRARIAAAVSRVRAGTASNRVSGGRGAAVPSASPTPVNSNGGGEAAVMDEDDRAICSENTVKLQGWIDWNADTQAIPR